MGQPVAGNPTQYMFEKAFAAAGLDWRYLTLEVSRDSLADAVRGMKAMGFRGGNLTIPHKVAVIEHLDELSRESRVIGAVNTVRREGGRLIGENTDGKGFLRGVRNDVGIDPAGKRVVLLGAGGAARAIAAELILAGVSDLLVVNRSAERGEKMTADLKASKASAQARVAWCARARSSAEAAGPSIGGPSAPMAPRVTQFGGDGAPACQPASSASAALAGAGAAESLGFGPGLPLLATRRSFKPTTIFSTSAVAARSSPCRYPVITFAPWPIR